MIYLNKNEKIVEKIDEFTLTQRSSKDNKFIYTVYENEEYIESWESDENLKSLSIMDRYDTETYTRFEEVISDIYSFYDDEDKDYLKYPLYGNVKTIKNIIPERPKGKTGFLDKLNKSDTLVIHCQDPSTVMLKQIYADKNWDVLNDGSIVPEELEQLLQSHSRIIMLGHGTAAGLINIQYSEGGSSNVINSSNAKFLKDKKLFVIWCNADKFFNTHNIGKGQFITGNMPSEVWECRMAGCGGISSQLMLENITYWCKLCADVVEDCLNGNVKDSVKYIRTNYIKKYGDHPVTHYNSVRTFILGTSYEQNEKEVSEIEDKLNIHPNWDKYNKKEIVGMQKNWYASKNEEFTDITIPEDSVNLTNEEYDLVDELADIYADNLRDLKFALQEEVYLNSYEANYILIHYLGYDRDEVYALPSIDELQ